MIPDRVKNKFCAEVIENYDLTKGVYSGALFRITGLICPRHGEFSQYSAQLRKPDGAHCPKCGIEKRAETQSLGLDEFVARSKEVHGGRYRYEGVEYKNMNSVVTVECTEHGPFRIKPAHHIFRRQGCPACAQSTRGRRKDVVGAAKLSAATKVSNQAEAFLELAYKIHGGRYQYVMETYRGMREYLDILCPDHGVFRQAAQGHVYKGYGCPRCSHHESKEESRIASYLSTFTQVIQRDRNIIAPKELDIVLPEHGLAVEYCGMYWHSAMKAEDEAEFRTKHKEKYDMAAEKGLRLITIYESEWLERPHAIRRFLRNAVGKSRGKLMARKCELRKVSHKEAVGFFERYHPQGGAGHGENYALIHKGKIVACMRFTKGANDRGLARSRTWTLSRYATRVTVSGGASRLFTSFVREFNPEEVKSFSDNRYFSGGMYEQLGFVLDAELSPDYMVWSPKIGLRPKPHYQRRKLPARQADHGVTVDFDPKTDTRTEAQVTYAMGCGRIFDCGRKRWVWAKQ